MNISQPSITEDKLNKLWSVRNNNCISIYVPMYKSGRDRNQKLGQAQLRSNLKAAGHQLLQRGLGETEIEKLLAPAMALNEDAQLWGNPSEGLAVLLAEGRDMEWFQIPLHFEPKNYVADEFYLLPLLPLFHHQGHYYLLELSQDHVRLYEGSPYSFEDLYVNDFAPEQLEEAVGFDFEQKMLQFRTGHAFYGAGSFHGQGEGKEDQTKEIKAYFRQIDKGVNKAVTDKKAPLVLACVDWLYPLYKEVNTYPQLFGKNISGDPEHKPSSSLHLASWEIVAPYFEQDKKESIHSFQEMQHTARTSYQISEIVPAAVHGRIDILFIENGRDMFGTYNEQKNCVILDTEKTATNLSLVNFAAKETYTNGGRVYHLEAEEMPFKGRPMNAVFRY